MFHMFFLSSLKCCLSIPLEILFGRPCCTSECIICCRPTSINLYWWRSTLRVTQKYGASDLICMVVLWSYEHWWSFVQYISFFFFLHPLSSFFLLLGCGHFLLPSISENCNLIAVCVCPGPPVCMWVCASGFTGLWSNHLEAIWLKLKIIPV